MTDTLREIGIQPAPADIAQSRIKTPSAAALDAMFARSADARNYLGVDSDLLDYDAIYGGERYAFLPKAVGGVVINGMPGEMPHVAVAADIMKIT